AVAIAWGGYFTSLLSGFGISFPDWTTHGYWQVHALPGGGDTAMQTLLPAGPHNAGVTPPREHSPVRVRGLNPRVFETRRARERARQQHHGRDQASRADALRRRRRAARQSRELQALRAERIPRNPPGGGDCLLRLYRLRRHLHRGGGDQGSATQHA